MEFESNFVISQGMKIHYWRTNKKAQTLLLIHGISDDGLCWSPVADQLAEDYDVIMIDLLGHGKTDAPEKGYTVDFNSTLVYKLIESLGIEKPIVLGHSLGAVTTLVFAGMYPNIPKAIILEDPPAFWDVKDTSQEIPDSMMFMIDMFNKRKRMTTSELMEEGRHEGPEWSQEELKYWANAKHRYDPKIVRYLHADGITKINFPDLFSKIACPVLLITGDNELGAISNQKDLIYLKGLIPQIRVSHVAGSGHCIRRDQFTHYMEIVNAELNTIG